MKAAIWFSYLPLLPLAVLLLSGLYLFVLPYRRRAAGSRRAIATA
ncbi:putative membrane protein [Rhodococcus sp. MTM3W5.2]|nr:putative membrane protein [Rhodococcus sp. MTM3W5.2]